MNRHVVPILFLLWIVALIGCGGMDDQADITVQLPYPSDQLAASYQTWVDSSEFEWFLDVKGASSAFINDMIARSDSDAVSTTDIIIKGEGFFHAAVELRRPDKIYLITLERPFKHLGRRSIWQVVKLEEK